MYREKRLQMFIAAEDGMWTTCSESQRERNLLMTKLILKNA
jgi:hypothetical protein